MTKSKDGERRSPDAHATTHGYAPALDEEDDHLGQLLLGERWRSALVNFSFDNCSVNMGEKTEAGVGKQVFAVISCLIQDAGTRIVDINVTMRRRQLLEWPRRRQVPDVPLIMPALGPGRSRVQY